MRIDDIMTIQNILVTGASGFLGLAVCRALSNIDVQVSAIWHGTEPDLQHLRLQWLRADLAASFPSGIQRAKFDAVIHLAAVIPSRNIGLEDAAFQNRKIDERVFHFAADRRLTVIYASGTSVYGDSSGRESVSEQARCSPSNPYACAKLDGERSGAEMAERSGSRFVALRVCAPYGPGQKARTVMQAFIDNASGNRALEYFGSGTREQAFTYVSDAANAFVLALRSGGGCYNIAGEAPVTMKNLALLVADQAGISRERVRPAGQP